MITWQDLARHLTQHSQDKSEWAGMPLPVEGMPMHLEPRYPYQLDKIFQKEKEPNDDGMRLANQWWDSRLNTFVLVIKKDGRTLLGYRPVGSGVTLMLNTMGAAHVWLLSSEAKAVEKLEQMVGEWRTRCYLLTGTFLERSKRSGVCYIFRRLRPTIAFRDDRILCGLCLHPIGYYGESYAGAMCPTDDVLAHLCMMRGDEPKFWANANQHPVWHPSCGLR